MMSNKKDRTLVAFSGGVIGGMIGAFLAVIGMQIVGRLMMAGAKKQQMSQFQEYSR